DATTAAYALVAAATALLATALLHILLLSAPRARTFFGWIMGLAIAIAAFAPFSQAAESSSQTATALINLVAGVAIVSLLRSVGRTSVQPRTATEQEHLTSPPPPRDPEGNPNQASNEPALQGEGILPDVSQEEYRAAELRARRQYEEEERAQDGPRHE